MRDYAIVPSKFWITPLAKKLRGNPAAQVVALYLTTGPHANMIGLYHCPIAYIAQDAGIPFEGASEALASLVEAGYCDHDSDADFVFVRDMAREQIGESLAPADNRVKAVIKQWQACPSDALKHRFHDRYASAFSLPPMEAPVKAQQCPIEAPSVPHRSQEQDQDQEQDHSVPFGTGAAGAAGQPGDAVTADRIQLAAMLRADEEGPLTEDEEKLIWNGGLAVLLASYDSTTTDKARDAKARMFIGGLGKKVKDAGADRRVLFEAIQGACRERPLHPESWLSAAIATRLGKRAAPNRQEAQEQRNHAGTDEWVAQMAAQMAPQGGTDQPTGASCRTSTTCSRNLSNPID